MSIFNFRDGHMTNFRHPSGACICQKPGHILSRLAKGTPSESRLSIGTIGFGKTVSCRLCAGQSKGAPKREKCCFLDLASSLTLQYSGNFFYDSTCPHPHFDGLPPKSRRSIVFIHTYIHTYIHPRLIQTKVHR